MTVGQRRGVLPGRDGERRYVARVDLAAEESRGRTPGGDPRHLARARRRLDDFYPRPAGRWRARPRCSAARTGAPGGDAPETGSLVVRAARPRAAGRPGSVRRALSSRRTLRGRRRGDRRVAREPGASASRGCAPRSRATTRPTSSTTRPRSPTASTTRWRESCANSNPPTQSSATIPTPSPPRSGARSRRRFDPGRPRPGDVQPRQRLRRRRTSTVVRSRRQDPVARPRDDSLRGGAQDRRARARHRLRRRAPGPGGHPRRRARR